MIPVGSRKRIRRVLVVGLLVAGVVGTLVALGVPKRLLTHFLRLDSDTDPTLAIVETRGNLESSRIVLLGEDLQAVSELLLPYASVAPGWQAPYVGDGRMYVVPAGLDGFRSERTLLEFDYVGGEVIPHTADRVNLYGVVATDDYLFACSNLNFTSYVTRVSKNGLPSREVSLPETHVHSINLCGDKLCVFAGDLTEGLNRSDLLVYDLDLNLVASFDLSDYGVDQCRSRVLDGSLWFTSWFDGSEAMNGSTKVGVFDPSALTLSQIDFGDPVYDVYPGPYGPLALIGSQVDIDAGRPLRMRCYTSDLSQVVWEEDVGSVSNACVHDNRVYTLSNWEVVSYEIGPESLSRLESLELEPMDDSFSYISSIVSL